MIHTYLIALCLAVAEHKQHIFHHHISCLSAAWYWSNITGTSFVIRFHMTCIVYASLTQFHLIEWHTSSAHQLIVNLL